MSLINRKPNRLQNFDYNQNGAYFITICVKNRKKILCDIVGDDVGIIPYKNRISNIFLSIKILITKEIGKPIFQRSFYDHIIRNQEDYNEILEYIENNPKNWMLKHKTQGD